MLPRISVAAAGTLFQMGSAALFVGAALVVVGTFLVWWTGNVKEEYAEHRISTVERDAGQRIISMEQFKVIKAQLREHPLKVPLVVRWPDDVEAATFARMLMQPLMEVPVPGISPQMRPNSSTYALVGLYVTPGAGDQVADVLRRIGLHVNMFNQEPVNDSILIDVGIKPQVRPSEQE